MYRADVSPQQTLDALQSDPNAVIVDVRTMPEWMFVGQPTVTRMANISWQVFPSMQIDADFEQKIRAAGITEDHSIYFLCRSGVRSAAAAAAMTQAGFPNCYNITGGFEGDVDANAHRGHVNGWKASGLAWAQK